MYSPRKIRGNTSSILITIFLLAVIIVTLPAIMTTTTSSSSTNRVYGQQADQMDLNTTDSSPNIQNTSEKIVHVGDIDIAYKISNNVTISREENIELLNATLGAGWLRLHPESLENVTEGKGFFGSISPEAQEG